MLTYIWNKKHQATSLSTDLLDFACGVSAKMSLTCTETQEDNELLVNTRIDEK